MLKVEAEENISISVVLLYWGEDVPSHAAGTGVASSGWRWVLLKAAEDSQPAEQETHGHLLLLMIWAADPAFLGELQNKHILLPFFLSRELPDWQCHCHCAPPCTDLVALQECGPQPARSKSAAVLVDLGNTTGGGGKTNKERSKQTERPKSKSTSFPSSGCWLYLELWLVYVCIQSKFSEEYPAVISQRV